VSHNHQMNHYRLPKLIQFHHEIPDQVKQIWCFSLLG